jgi:hypothetical protein
MEGFKRWALTHFKGTQHDRKFSFMDRGKFGVSDDDIDRVWARYVSHVSRGAGPVYLIEIKSHPLFVMFYDVDIDSDMSEDDICSATENIIATTLTSAKWKGPGVAAACFRPSKKGVHIVFPGTSVDAATAKILVRSMPALAGITLDDTVYRQGTGLRALFSAKHADDLTAYVPWMMMEDGIFGPMKNVSPSVSNMKLFSVVCPDSPVLRVAVAALKKRPRSLSPVIMRKASTDKTSADSASTDTLRSIGALCTSCSVTGVTRFNGATVVKTDCRHCPNMERPHKSATIYFVIACTAAEISLRRKCFCRCSRKGLFSVTCREMDRMVRPFPLPRKSNKMCEILEKI